MKTEKLVDQLELYSNAIVGFTVAQCVGFSVTFGTSADFGCELKISKPTGMRRVFITGDSIVSMLNQTAIDKSA